MEAADTLYGVSMGDDGVSKVVSRRLPREVPTRRDAAARRRVGQPTNAAGRNARTGASLLHDVAPIEEPHAQSRDADS